jgi:hypothetical protein
LKQTELLLLLLPKEGHVQVVCWLNQAAAAAGAALADQVDFQPQHAVLAVHLPHCVANPKYPPLAAAAATAW